MRVRANVAHACSPLPTWLVRERMHRAVCYQHVVSAHGPCAGDPGHGANAGISSRLRVEGTPQHRLWSFADK